VALDEKGRSGSTVVFPDPSSHMINCGMPIRTSGDGVVWGSGVSSVPLLFVTQLHE